MLTDPPCLSPAASIRRDIVDLVRLMRFVKERRAALLAAKENTAAADELLVTLGRQLRIAWRSRFGYAAVVRAGGGVSPRPAQVSPFDQQERFAAPPAFAGG